MASRQKHKAISLKTKYKVIKLLDKFNCTPYPQILDQFRNEINSVESIEIPEIEDISVWDELTAGMDIRCANFSDYVNVDNEISTCEMSVMQTNEVKESEILVHVEDSQETDE
jgi:hypothetical protein